MELLAATVFLTVFLCSSAQSPPVVASADCKDAEIEKDAGTALDLINKHRREGYIFTLLRVADAHVQHVGNASILYFTLDVLDTECPVLSRKNWSSCGHRIFYPSTEFGQCKAVLYKNLLFKKEELFGYNCTISPVPQHLYKCKDCPVRVTPLLDVEKYIEEAQKILEKYNQESNETHNFRVKKVIKAFSVIGSRKGYYVEFIIMEADNPEAGFPKNESKLKFRSKRHGHMGFCTGRVIQDPEVVGADSCVIFDIPHGKHPFHHHHHCHNDSEEFYHRCDVPAHECDPPPPGPPHRDHHHHHRPHHHHDHHPHHHRRHRHHHPRDDSREFFNRSNVSGQEGGPPPPGPPHRDHDHHHHHHQHPPGHCHHCGPPCPPDGPCDHPRPPHFHRHGPHHQHHHHDHRCGNIADGQGGFSSEDGGSLRHHHSFHHGDGDSVHYIPVLSQNDVLQTPGASFLDRHPYGPHRGPKERVSPCRHTHGKHVVQPFPEIPSESKLCPGNIKSEPPTGLLLLYPSQSKQ
uniref:Histidine-rich glycoprotein n=1 Tax=Pogona vitticeps TaxID=103695 RepID=A0A6J0V233_9SAUR